MKKVLIVSDSLRMGGIQSSLKVFIKMLSTKDYDITLFLFNDTDKEFFKADNIKIISGSKLLKVISYTSAEAKQKGIFTFLIRKGLALLCRIFSANLIYKCIFFFEKRLLGYDVAISYSNNISDRSVYFGYNKFVLEKTDAKLKIGYIHADYGTIHFNVSDREFGVQLTFDGRPFFIRVPFSALVEFKDPSTDFMLSFHPKSMPAAADNDMELPLDERPGTVPDDKRVVSLDEFRKRKNQ